MTFSSQAQRLLKRLHQPWLRRSSGSVWSRRASNGAALGTVCAAMLLTACGGGTSQVEVFEPLRYFAFGDETSVLEADGRKYAVNALDASGKLDCALQPIWVQQVASSYGFAFAECNPSQLPVTNARMSARVGAKVADLTTQVDSQVAAGGFRDKDLATVLVGANDILDLYSQYPARSEASLLADARARGTQLALAVNRLVDLGVKVVISTVPDMGLTPFGRAQKAAFTDIDRAAFLTRLSAGFNEQLGVSVLLDGRFVGLVQADLQFQAIERSPLSFGVIDNSTPICTVALPQCTTATLVTGGDPNVFLWADGTRPSSGGHAQLAQLAVDRARRNPF